MDGGGNIRSKGRILGDFGIAVVAEPYPLGLQWRLLNEMFPWCENAIAREGWYGWGYETEKRLQSPISYTTYRYCLGARGPHRPVLLSGRHAVDRLARLILPSLRR